MKKIILLVLALLLAACSGGVSPDFDKNLAKWEGANITNYRYTLSIVCFCAFRSDMPLTIEVKNGEVISMTDGNGNPVTTTHPAYAEFESYSTIERLFLNLKADLTGEADDVAVTYDFDLRLPCHHCH